MQGLIAALGAALFVGNVAALLRPPAAPRRDPRARRGKSGNVPRPNNTDPTPPPVLRRGQTIAMAIFGLVIFVWSVASLVQ